MDAFQIRIPMIHLTLAGTGWALLSDDGVVRACLALCISRSACVPVPCCHYWITRYQTVDILADPAPPSNTTTNMRACVHIQCIHAKRCFLASWPHPRGQTRRTKPRTLNGSRRRCCGSFCRSSRFRAWGDATGGRAAAWFYTGVPPTTRPGCFHPTHPPFL